MKASQVLAVCCTAFSLTPWSLWGQEDTSEPGINHASRHGAPPRHHHHEVADPQPLFETTLTGAWDSLYVLEGRDMLDGDGLWSYALEAGYEDWTLGFWQGEGTGATYRELNLWLEYGTALGPFELSASYMHLWFLSDGFEDDEIGFGVAYTKLPWGITTAVDWYRSFVADGSFTEVSLSSELEVADWLTLAPAAAVGFNHGYLPDGHQGANHAVIVLEAAIPLRENVELGGYVSYSWAIDSQPDRFAEDENLLDFFYGGASVTVRF